MGPKSTWILLILGITVSSCSVVFNSPYKSPINVYLPESQLGYYRPNSVTKAGSKFLVSDGNNRILIYNREPTSYPATPDVVIGQINTSYNGPNYPNGISAFNNAGFGSITSDGTRIVAADISNNRVLIWNSIPTTNFQPADVVLGQPDFSSNSAGVTSTLFNGPRGVWLQGEKLYVADTSNHRVLIYNSVPTSSNTDPDYVLGQSTFTTKNSGRTATAMNTPFSVFVLGGVIYVADTSNARVMVWTTPISVNNQSADLVLGATNFTNAGNIAWCTGITGDGTRVFAVSYMDSLVRAWNSLPGASTATADYFLGQSNGATKTCNTGGTATASNLCNLVTIFSDGTKLYTPDQMNHRILVWNASPTVTKQPADLVLGQPSMSGTGIGGVDMTDPARAIHLPMYMEIAGGKFFVSSPADHRVLVWNSVPANPNSTLPDFVVGQPNLTTNQPTYGSLSSGNLASAQGLGAPVGIVSDGTQLYISQANNPGVSIFGSLPTTFLPFATGVLGETNFTSRTSGTTAVFMSALNQMAVSGQNLFGTDSGNNRVLVWNPLPAAASFATPASLVLGQPNFTSKTAGASSTTLSGPKGVATDGTHLIVADTSNNRVLIWNSLPTVNQQAADIVLGQPDMNSNSINIGGVSARSLQGPYGVWTDGTRLIVVDNGNNRVLIWNTFPTINQAPADSVIGQFDFASNTPNYNGISDQSLNSPTAALIYQSKLYIADTRNHRIVVK